MIIIFHTLWFITRYVVSAVAKSVFSGIKDDKSASLRTKYAGSSEIDFESGPRFFPPVYVQRYTAAKSVLQDERWNGKLDKVVDFGCAEFGFFFYMKHLEGVTQILAVDIDYDILDRYYCKAAPLHTDYLNPRKKPLSVFIYKGSIAYPDECLKGCDAVICIELIEHLYPDVLEDVPFTVFGFIKPLVAVFTTPNGDFNVLFKNMKGFRHPDHKFEWSREQFECWANNIVLRYPEYTVSFEDIGCDKASEKLGGCSQMAVFERHTFISSHPEKAALITEPSEKILQEEDFGQKYCLLREYEYPFRVDNRSEEEKIRDQAEYYIRMFETCEHFQEDDKTLIPLSCILPTVDDKITSVSVLENILRSAGWELVDHNSGGLAVMVRKEISSSEESDGDQEELLWAQPSNHSKKEVEEEEIWAQSEEQLEAWDSESWCTTEDSQVNVEEEVSEKQLVQESTVADQVGSELEMECPVQEIPEQDNCAGASHISVLFSSSAQDMSSSSLDDTQARTLTTITEETSGQLLDVHSANDKKFEDDSSTSRIIPSTFLEGSGSKLSMMRSDEALVECERELNKSGEVSQVKLHSVVKSGIPCNDEQREHFIVESDPLKVSDSPLISHSSPAVVREEGSDNSSQLLVNSYENILNLFPTCPSPQPCSLSSSSSNHLCLALQPELSGEFVSESVGRLAAPESPVAESFSLEEGNDRLADSGYPNSASAQDMDLDLTPEQVDELFTEGDVFADHHPDHLSDSASVSSKDSDSVNEEEEQPPHPPPPILPPQPDMLFEEAMNVENGDVANNNRDWEGNNAVAAAAILHEGLHDLRPLLEAAEDLDNDNEIQIHAVEPFPVWLLNLLGVANGGGLGGGGDAPRGRDVPLEQVGEDDDSASDPIVDEGLGDEYRLRSHSLSESLATDLDVAVDSESEGEALALDVVAESGAAGEPDVWAETMQRN